MVSPSTIPFSPAQLEETDPLSDALVATSQPFVGRWNRLISTTNWDKGRIIAQWRESLILQGLASNEYSDEAWSRLVGGVSAQHVGRLRRVFQRFGNAQEQYPGLYWSHFQAALEWSDAEMWLEGAKASDWSVAQMRTTRWETLGKVEAQRPNPADIVASEVDEDFKPAQPLPQTITGEYGEVSGPRPDGPDFGDESEPSGAYNDRSAVADDSASTGEPVELVRPFENLPELPDDLADAFETFKLAILRHKTDNWRAISISDVLRTLDALKSLATAPSDNAPPTPDP